MYTNLELDVINPSLSSSYSHQRCTAATHYKHKKKKKKKTTLKKLHYFLKLVGEIGTNDVGTFVGAGVEKLGNGPQSNVVAGIGAAIGGAPTTPDPLLFNGTT